MRVTLAAAASAGILGGAAAQDLRWQIPSPPSANELLQVAPFEDFDQDGYRDFLLLTYVNPFGYNWNFAVEIRSGRDAAALWQQPTWNRTAYSIHNAGDVDGDGRADIAVVNYVVPSSGPTLHVLEVWSPRLNATLSTPNPGPLWQVSGLQGINYARFAVLGDIDTDGDHRSDILTCTSHPNDSQVFVYNSNGALRYTLPMLGTYGMAVSLGKMPDMNGDGKDDFLVGVNSGNGVVLLVSGHDGAILRTHLGLLPGDKTCDFVRSVGDMDGDGVEDYAAFPWITAARAIVLVWSGATGQLLRQWPEFGNSVITGEDFDLDGVPDLAIGADWQVVPNLYGSTRLYSGRDGLELWRLDNAPFTPYGQGSQGYYGWMEYSASLGVQPGDEYPTIAWVDVDWFMVGTLRGRVRAYRTNFATQGPVTGTPCSSYGPMPLIGARKHVVTPTAHRARITVARGPAGGGAWLNFALANQTSYGGLPLPIDLTPFGLSGCNAYVGPMASYFTMLGSTGIDAGYGYVDLTQKLSISTAGISIVAQWLLFDPATLDYGATAKHELRVQ